VSEARVETLRTNPDTFSVTVMVNGRPRLVVAGTTVAMLVDDLGCGTRGIAVAVDRAVLPRSSWHEVVVDAGAQVEVVTAAAGG
jgi:sulfur carrier protein